MENISLWKKYINNNRGFDQGQSQTPEVSKSGVDRTMLSAVGSYVSVS